jgi:hypothetical protein
VYPNPVSTSTVLEVDIPETGKAQVQLINALGQQTGSIYSGMLTKGKHRLSLTDKINNLPAGMYMLKIQSGKQTGLVKIMIQ